MRFTILASLVSLLTSSATYAYPSPALEARTDGTVITPGGPVAQSKVHFVPPGAHIKHTSDAVLIVADNGTTLHSAPVPPTPSRRKRWQSGWITDATWYNTLGSPISSFTTSWNVPSNPNSWDGQTLFLFNSIEPATGDAILQPVLQYGGSVAGGGQYWSVASWYLCPTGTYFTTLTQVNVGQQLNGAITLTGQSGGTFSYVSAFTGLQNQQSLVVQNAEELVWATLTLETYGVTQATDYPPGSTSFYNTNLKLVNNGHPAISWSPSNDAADRISTVVDYDGSSNAVVRVIYPFYP